MQNVKEVRLSAICLHSKNSMSAKSSSRTGHLIRHLDLCPAKKEKGRSGKPRSLLKYNTDGSVNHWEYSLSVARTELCCLIARLDQPLVLVNLVIFLEYRTHAHNPRFLKSSRKTTARGFI
jgi:hypothetical protein